MIYDGVYAWTGKKRVGVNSYGVDQDCVHMFFFIFEHIDGVFFFFIFLFVLFNLLGPDSHFSESPLTLKRRRRKRRRRKKKMGLL